MSIPKIKPEWLVGITMTSEQKAKWLAALRSGEYCQSQHFLYSHNRKDEQNGFCCLGVAAKAVFDYPLGRLEQLCSFPKDEFIGRLGPREADGKIASIQGALVHLNDELRWSFTQIADFIEANIPACDEVRS